MNPTLVRRPALWYCRAMLQPTASSEAPDFEQLDEFLERFDATLARDPVQALCLVDSAAPAVRAHAAWVLCRADALDAARGTEAAVEYLEAIVESEPGFADAHHYLGELHRELGNERSAVRHHLDALRLDTLADTISQPIDEDLHHAMAAEAGRAVAGLPSRIRQRLLHVPILLQPRPSERLVAAGFDSRSLGLFEGPNLSEAEGLGAPAEPTAITLFTCCLMDAFGDDESELLQQIRVTVLHEVGHYFCLDEDQLAELGLD